MTIVKFRRIVSFSSEDPKYPAINLLNPEVSKCWKCKEIGEKQAVVILELEKTCKISGIDIGNENSAFIEIFVGKSATPDKYEILRVSSLLMTVQEAKQGVKKNVVRFFKQDEFENSVVEESWDRIKISCSQPFNKQTAYGLSFIKVHTKDVDREANLEFKDVKLENKNSPLQLGKFSLKQESEREECVTVGSFFAKRNDINSKISSTTTTVAAAIKAASNDPKTITNTTAKNKFSDLLGNNKDTKKKKLDDEADDFTELNDSRRSITGPLLYVDDPNAPPLKKPKDDRKKTDLGPNFKNTPQSSEKAKPETPSSMKKIKENIKRKPFGKLLEDVVFVISGFQNPYRSNLRTKALNLGAKYKADWDSTCTHLICAFPNTPKAAVVKNLGWIVKKDWIEDCHSQRKRLCCKNYKLDKSDTFSNPNDIEIWEELPDDIDVSESSVKSQKKPENRLENDLAVGLERRTNSANDDIYEVDTDIDDDVLPTVSRADYEEVSLPVLPIFFADKKFYFGSDITKQSNDLLQRYVCAFKGEISLDVESVNYIITEDTRYKENVSNTPVVLPDWIWECNDERRFVPVQPYLL